MPTGLSASKPGTRISPLLILHSVIRDPACVEQGLRFFAMDPASSRDACMAWGLDSDNRQVALYVTSNPSRFDDLKERFRSRIGPGEIGGRLLLLAPRFCGELFLEDWTVEPWRWGCDESDDGDVWIEKQESTGQKEIPDRAVLTAEEIESLVGTRA